LHIADGILRPEIIVATQAAGVAVVAYGFNRARSIESSPARTVTTLGLAASALFIVTSATFPAMAGTSAHPSGTPMLALMFGPFATAVVAGIVVFFEALMGHGGLSAWGADTLTMGFLGPVAAYSVYRLVRRTGGSAFLGGALAAAVANLVIYLSTAVLIAYSLPVGGFTTALLAVVLAYLPAEVPIMIAESFVTGALVARLHSFDIASKWAFVCRARGQSGARA
jgi:cobalt/nickel transport system permease protein